MRDRDFDCRLSTDGDAITLRVPNDDGTTGEVALSVDEARQLSAKLPRLLEAAFRVKFSGELLQSVYPLHGYIVKPAADDGHLLLTMSADDGFDVVFAVRLELAAALGRDLAARGAMADG